MMEKPTVTGALSSVQFYNVLTGAYCKKCLASLSRCTLHIVTSPINVLLFSSVGEIGHWLHVFVGYGCDKPISFCVDQLLSLMHQVFSLFLQSHLLRFHIFDFLFM